MCNLSAVSSATPLKKLAIKIVLPSPDMAKLLPNIENGLVTVMLALNGSVEPSTRLKAARQFLSSPKAPKSPHTQTALFVNTKSNTEPNELSYIPCGAQLPSCVPSVTLTLASLVRPKLPTGKLDETYTWFPRASYLQTLAFALIPLRSGAHAVKVPVLSTAAAFLLDCALYV